MNCDRVDPLLTKYHDNELSLGLSRQVEQHLEACLACRAELQRLHRLSVLLTGCPLPRTLTRAEEFWSQMAVRLPNRSSTRQNPSWAWLAVPTSLILALVVLQGLLILTGTLISMASLAEWGGTDLSLWFSRLFVERNATRLVTGSAVRPYVLSVLGFALPIALYLMLILVFVPYVGWMSVLLRDRRQSGSSEGETDGSS
jgi:hypothetical protein